MFQASIGKALIFKKVIEAIKELVTDVNFEVSENGISLQAMDASHVALVAFLLKREKFEEYYCANSQIFGINILNLSKILKCADNDDRITIKYDNAVSKVSFIFEGRNDERISQFNLNLIALDSEQLGIPDQEYSAVVNMKSEEFSRVCRELSQLSDTLSVSVNKEKITFSVGGDIGDGEITMKNKNSGKNPLIIDVVDPVSCSYAMRYLNLFNKASGLSDEICISLSENLPLILCFDFDLGYIKYYLAPKVNDD